MKKTIKTAIFTLLLLTLAISTALLIYLHFFASTDHDLSGEWTAQLDLTEPAAVSAYSWLRDIEGVSFSQEDMESYMPKLTVMVDAAFTQTDNAAGTFVCSVSKESYEVCSQSACESLAAAFRDLLAKRLSMAGYTDGADEEAIEALVTETFGMSTEEYLKACGPKLIPTLEELQARYDGSGAYETAEDRLTRRFEEGGTVVTKTESYIRQGASLILMGELDADSLGLSSGEYPVVYTLKQSAK